MALLWVAIAPDANPAAWMRQAVAVLDIAGAWAAMECSGI